jgi:predicted ArsR family transcriptional regulator
MDKTQGIEQLFATGMSIRQIARTLEINRKTVDRHLAAFGSKGATAAEAPTGSDDSKGAKAPRIPFCWQRRQPEKATRQHPHRVANARRSGSKSSARSSRV